MELYEDHNCNSVVCYRVYGNASFLLTGDLPSEYEEKLYALPIEPRIIVAGHHGSNTSNSYLGKYRPDYFVISAGKGNDYHYPHPSVLRKALEYTRGKKVYGTWRSGDIIFSSDGKRLRTDLSYLTRLSIDDAGAK